jgi:hypothetical protein
MSEDSSVQFMHEATAEYAFALDFLHFIVILQRYISDFPVVHTTYALCTLCTLPKGLQVSLQKCV